MSATKKAAKKKAPRKIPPARNRLNLRLREGFKARMTAQVGDGWGKLSDYVNELIEADLEKREAKGKAKKR